MKKEGQIRIPSGCAISAVISKEGRRMTGEKIIESMIPMHDRSNGLGGGFGGAFFDLVQRKRPRTPERKDAFPAGCLSVRIRALCFYGLRFSGCHP